MRSSKAVKAKATPAAFVPCFEGPIEGWVVNGMRANYFRVSRTLSREEYLQEAYEVFLRISSRYEVDEPQHLMCLFKTSWNNRLNDLATADTRHRMFVSMPMHRDEDGEEVESVDFMGESDNEGTLAIMLRQAPADVALVLNLFLSAPQELVETALASWRGKDRRFAAGGSARICKLLGLDPSIDVMQKVEDYFSPVHS